MKRLKIYFEYLYWVAGRALHEMMYNQRLLDSLIGFFLSLAFLLLLGVVYEFYSRY